MCVAGCMDAVRAAVRSGVSRRGFFRGTGAGAVAFAATAVAPAGRALAGPAPAAAAMLGEGRRVIDLTHTLTADFPTFLGDPAITFEDRAVFDKDGYNMKTWTLVEHTGTHLDAPVHFSENAAAVEAIPVETLVVPLAVVDVTAAADADPDHLLSRADLDAFEAAHGKLPAGCCVAMHSGWGKLATSDTGRFLGRDIDGTMHFPGIAPEAALWLLKERDVAGLAVDTLSLDKGASQDFPTHKIWLPAGRWGLENVANLDQAPASGATLVVGLPKVKDATGAPVRLLALA